MRYILLAPLILVLTGCGSTSPMSYDPSPMDFEDAIVDVERLIMTQHPIWRPDYIEFDSQYLLLGYGTRSTGRISGAAVGGAVFGSTSSSTHAVSERLYFEQVKGITLMSWTRKMKQYYAISIRDSDGEHVGHVYRTRDIESAEQFVDAMNVVVSKYNENPETGLDVPKSYSYVIVEKSGDANPEKDIYSELLKLDDLRKRGILSEEEFEAQKKKLLEAN